jgi:hypothetical protein
MYTTITWLHRNPTAYRWRTRWLVWTSRRKGLPISARDYLARYVAGGTFADIGGMWGINGEHSFWAEEAGATRVVLVDIDATEEFERKRSERDSKVEFVRAEASSPELVDEVGVVDVVWCFGLLYHHPSPFELVANLRRICGRRLILESLVIPELPGFPNMATYYPMQPPPARRHWNTAGRGGAATQLGISVDFDPGQGYSNNFWGMSPSCVESLLVTAGFAIELSRPIPRSPMRHVFVAHPVDGTAVQLT